MARDDLGRLLVEQGRLSPQKLEEALQHQVIYGGALDTTLLELGLLEEPALLSALAQGLKLPAATPTMLAEADAERLKVFPQKLAQKYGIVPFKVEGRNLSVAMAAAPELGTLDDIGFMLSVYLRPHAALEVHVHQALHRLYGVPLPARTDALLNRAKAPPRTPPQPAPGEQWVANEPYKTLAEPLDLEPSSTPDAPASPVPAEPVPVVASPTALSGLLSSNKEPPPVETEVVPPEDRRAERVTWRLADARAEFALSTSRDDIVEVLLRFAYKALDFASVLVLQGGQFIGWDSIGEGQTPRSIGHVKVPLAAGSALSLVEQTASHYLGPLKPGDPLPDALGRPRPKVALLVPFFVKGRLVGVLYGDRGTRGIAPRAVADVQALVPDLGRALEALILRLKRARLGFVDEMPARAGGIKEALARNGAEKTEPPLPAPVAPEVPPEARPRESIPPRQAYVRTQEMSLPPLPPLPPAESTSVPPLDAVTLVPGTPSGVELAARMDSAHVPSVEPQQADGPLPPSVPREDTLFAPPPEETAAATEEMAVPQDAAATEEVAAPPVENALHGVAADWSAWAPEPARPPPLPRRTATQVLGSVPVQISIGSARPPPMPDDALRSAVDPAEATERHVAALLKEAETASAEELPRLGDAILRTPKERKFEELVDKAVGRSKDAPSALDALLADKPLALAHALRVFPGPLASNVFLDQDAHPALEELSPLGRILVRMGDAAGALAVAVGVGHARRDARFLAVLMAAEVKHPSVPALVVRAVFDAEPRIAYLAAQVLDRMLLPNDVRVQPARAALNVVRTALEKGTEEQKLAAARAATQVRHAPFVPALIELLGGRNRDLDALALSALKEIARQDFGSSVRRWRGWWKDNGARRRTEWLLDALAHKERELRQGAQRELYALTGEYMGYHFDAPKAEREAAITRWRSWWEQQRERTDLP